MSFEEARALSWEPFFGDETDTTTLSDKFVTCGKEHRCSHCWGYCGAGERARALTERNNEDRIVRTFYFCNLCCKAAAGADADAGKAIDHRLMINCPEWYIAKGLEPPARCIACALPLMPGDLVLDEIGEGGLIHAACCGPNRDGYCTADGDPLPLGEPLPTGWEWQP